MWIIYGGDGYIGTYFCDYISMKHVYIDFVKSSSRIENVEDVSYDMDKYPNVTNVLCFVGRTSGPGNNTIDYLHGKYYDNIKDNLYAPLVLMKLCKDRNIHMTYLGTGCIFEYSNQNDPPFTEDSKPNFFGSGYSLVKGFTDLIARLYPDVVLNVRIRMPIFGKKHLKDFIYKIINYNKICNKLNTVTVFDDLIEFLVQDIINKRTGTVNLVNPGPIYHKQILDLYKEKINPKHEYILSTEEELYLLEKRSNNVLKSSYPKCPDAWDSIQKIIYNYS